jgi:hypothetical protein
LCGSTKFKKEFEDTMWEESIKGHIVLSVCGFSHADRLAPTEEQKELFDKIHLAKIDMSTEILVVNPGDYIGNSTAKEIAYAKSRGKMVRYTHPHMESK